MIIAENERGYLLFDGNEFTIGSKVGDPPKMRLTSPVNADGGGGGAISANVSRRAGVVCDGGQQDEIGLWQIKQDERVRGQVGTLSGEETLHLRDGAVADADDAMTKISETFHDSLLGVGTNLETGERASRSHMASPQGRFSMELQEDGNLVVYDTSVQPWKAVWSIWTGLIP